MYLSLLFLVSCSLAVCAYFIPRVQIVTGASAMITMALWTGYVAATLPYIFGLGLVVTGVFQIANFARLLNRRLHQKHLQKAFFIGGARLLCIQFVLLGLGLATNASLLLSESWGYVVMATQVCVVGFVSVLVIYRLYRAEPQDVRDYLSDKELPTVSVLIPARNEDNDLIEVLRSVVANDYPKLEILVLDDCSSSGRIPEIVKDFAHDGVRFIEGEEPKEGWLAKNQAYAKLADSSSGKWLLFMGVDVRLGPNSIRSMVTYAHAHRFKMLSVLPHRSTHSYAKGFFSPLRYFKELSRFRLHKAAAPTLSTAWLIERNSYEELGGVEAVARKVIPEHYFANELYPKNLYGFVRSNDFLKVSTAKSLVEQLRTSVRVTYPSHHGRLEWSCLTVLVLAGCFFAPFAQLLFYATGSGSTLQVVVYSALVGLLVFCHILIALATNPVVWSLALINFPYLVIQEICIEVVSMYSYEFGKVVWKERNICLPVLKVVPRLPDV